MHDVADRVTIEGLLGAIAAAIAAIALICRARANTVMINPLGFPKDASVQIPKYQRAFTQLESMVKTAERSVPPKTASDFALHAFSESVTDGMTPSVQRPGTRPPAPKQAPPTNSKNEIK